MLKARKYSRNTGIEFCIIRLLRIRYNIFLIVEARLTDSLLVTNFAVSYFSLLLKMVLMIDKRMLVKKCYYCIYFSQTA